MIISASRRTDIPAFYAQWFINRLKEGYVLITNPRNAGRLGRVELAPGNVDCIVFWTKNPLPMLDKLEQLEAMGYAFYTHFTLTPYDEALEGCLPPKPELVRAFRELSQKTSAQRVLWRYDPIVVDAKHTINWHIAQFAEMCAALHRYTKRCILSFIDPYKNISDKFRSLRCDEMIALASGFSVVAQTYDMALYTCAEEIELAEYGIAHAACIDQRLVEQITGCRIKAKNDGNQRAACGCIESVDIGAYDTCPHGCTYCYATSSPKTVWRRVAAHDPSAPMITGYPKGNEIITDRTMPSQKINQLSLFEEG